MGKFYVLFVLLFVNFILNIDTLSSGYVFTHDRKRIGPAGVLEAERSCMEKFEVSDDTIIRTEDSKKLGAKFINVSDVGNVEDCLNFCCSERLCNVAVFSEKSPFSCYLFDCGEADDFHCKFTTHTSYTSALLSVPRSQKVIGPKSAQEQHEAELTNLRGLFPPDSDSEVDVTSLSPRQAAPNSTHTPPPTTPTVTSPKTSAQQKEFKGSKCSRYEFECHTGDCIAIYDVCNGIPQCQDASDEGHDCPRTTEERGVFNHRTNILDYSHGQDYRAPDDGLSYNAHQKPQPYYSYNQRMNWQAHRQDYPMESGPYHQDYPEYMSGPVRGHGIPQQARGPPQSGPQMPYDAHVPLRYPEQHAQGYNQDTVAQVGPSLQSQSAYLRQQVLPVNDQHQGSGRRQQYPQLPIIGDQVSGQQFLQDQSYPGRLNSPFGSDQKLLMKPQVPSVSGQENYGSQMTQTQMVKPHPDHIYSQERLSPGQTKDVVQPLPTTRPDVTTQAGVQNVTSTTAKSRVGVQEQPSSYGFSSLSRLEVDLKGLERDEEEQKSQTSGAVLALSLGVCITAILTVLVGCRLQGFKRRMSSRHRGGRSPLEHDADYLVNGMYL